MTSSTSAQGPIRFRKKPVVIEAVQWDGDQRTFDTIERWSGKQVNDTDGYTLLIPTLEGTMAASLNDWIIRGVKGELYPCKPDIFAATYALAALSPTASPASPSGVRVRPLEWEEIEYDRADGQTDTCGEWEAPSIVGVYAVNISTCGDMHAPWEVFGGDDGKIGNFPTLDEAKAAAQADYEARILSALASDATPAPTRPEDGGEA